MFKLVASEVVATKKTEALTIKSFDLRDQSRSIDILVLVSLYSQKTGVQVVESSLEAEVRGIGVQTKSLSNQLALRHCHVSQIARVNEEPLILS